jgi:glucan phosphoethanolaminetransferase (alkaline phosphatase superfamily)
MKFSTLGKNFVESIKLLLILIITFLAFFVVLALMYCITHYTCIASYFVIKGDLNNELSDKGMFWTLIAFPILAGFVGAFALYLTNKRTNVQKQW